MRITDDFSSAEKLDSELLRTFLAIAEAGSFTKGADQIFRSQSALSLQIKRLENLLGQPVFERHGRGIALTTTGKRLRPVAQRVIQLLDEAQAELKPDGLRGSIRIGIPGDYGEAILPQVIAKFTHDYPKVDLSVQCSFSGRFPQALQRGELDIAVYHAECNKAGSCLLKQQKTFWASSRYHLAHEQDPVPLALFDRDCWWRDQALEAFEHAQRRFRVVYSSDSIAGIIAAIEAGVAIGMLVETSLQDNFIILSQRNGFPQTPDSNLILECRSGLDSPLAKAMASAIKDAFGHSGNV